MSKPPFDMQQIAGLSIRHVIDRHAQSCPDQVFLLDSKSGRTVTYAELRASARAIVGHIAAQGVRPGDAVAYAMPNGPHAALTVLGLFYGGYLATAINLVAGNDTIAYVIEHSEAKLLLSQGKALPVVAAALKGVNGAPPVVEVEDGLFDAGQGPEPLAPAADSDGLLMYTSGTTGRPKGVVLTQANLLAGGAVTTLAHQLTPHDRAMCVLPLYHINGLSVTLLAPLVSGGSVVVPDRFSVSTFWQTIRDLNCTWFSVVPTQISYLLHEDAAGEGKGKLRFGRSASAPLSPDVQQAFEAKFGVPIIETMGLTETTAQILSNPLPPGTRKIGSPGIPFGNEVIIADERQREVGRGQEGEVLVRGPNVMRLYLKNEEATREAITPEGWLRTGDLGRMDADGYVFVTGRLKELIIKGGENIAPREIDEALYSHPDVIEAAAFARPCASYGQRIEAGVMLSPGSTLTEEELIALCREKIGAFKSPDRIHVLPELPKGPSGKIQRKKLSEVVTIG